MATFKQKLISIRAAQGIDYAQAAEIIGIPEQQYRDFEYGPATISVVERIGLLTSLGVSLEEAREAAREPDSGSLADFFESDEDPVPPFVRLQDGVIQVLFRSNQAPYEIGADRITSPEMVMRWIDHLSRKTWVTKQHIREFVSVCSTYLGTSLHPV